MAPKAVFCICLAIIGIALSSADQNNLCSYHFHQCQETSDCCKPYVCNSLLHRCINFELPFVRIRDNSEEWSDESLSGSNSLSSDESSSSESNQDHCLPPSFHCRESRQCCNSLVCSRLTHRCTHLKTTSVAPTTESEENSQELTTQRSNEEESIECISGEIISEESNEEGTTVEVSSEVTTEESNEEGITEEVGDEITTEESNGEDITEEVSGEITTEESNGEEATDEVSGEITTEESNEEGVTAEVSGEITTEESNGEEATEEEVSGEITTEESNGDEANGKVW